nr:uncharacterized protein LOC127314986 [Lolium perenne]
MVSDDAFDPRRPASASFAAAASASPAAPPPSSLATASPFMASAPLAWAYPAARSPAAPAAANPAPAPSAGPTSGEVPSSSTAAHGRPPPYDSSPAQEPYRGGPYPAPYVASRPAPYVAPTAAPYVAPHAAPYAAASAASYGAYPGASYEAYGATPPRPTASHGVISPANYGYHQLQQYRGPPPSEVPMPYGASPPYEAVPAAPSADQGPFHFAHLVTVKLSADNYLLSRAQVLPLMRSHYLEGYVDGSDSFGLRW